MKIHPTAIISPEAELHESVEVGPYTIIEEGVKIGKGNKLASGIRVYRGTTIGKNNEFYHNSVIGCPPQHLAYEPSSPTKLVIGNNNIFREFVNLNRGYVPDGPGTIIGNENFFMASTHAGHDAVIGNNNILAQGAVLGGHVEMGNRVFVGGLVAVHQFCRIGDFCMIGGAAKLTMDVPPFSVSEGNPAYLAGLNLIGMQRGGLDEAQNRSVKNAYKKLFRSGKSIDDVLMELGADSPTAEVSGLVQFYLDSERGVTPYLKPEDT